MLLAVGRGGGRGKNFSICLARPGPIPFRLCASLADCRGCASVYIYIYGHMRKDESVPLI